MALLCLVVAFTFTRCEQETKIDLSVEYTASDLPVAGGSATFTVVTNTAWSISNVNNDSWISSISPSNGSGSGQPVTITVTIDGNSTPANRTATLRVAAKDKTHDVTITQLGEASLVVNYTPEDIPIEGGSATFTVTANANWTITNVNQDAWITDISPSTGTAGGPTTVTVTIAENPGTTSRPAKLRITADNQTEDVDIIQLGATNLTVSEPENIATAGGSSSFTVTSNSSWTIVKLNPAHDWYTLSSSAGTGTQVITITVPNEHDAPEPRTSTLQIIADNDENLQRTVVVTQLGDIKLTVNHNPTTEIAAAGSTVTIAITSNTEWTISSEDNWITFDMERGTGNGTVVATIANNTETVVARPGVITVTATAGDNSKNESVNISQAGVPLIVNQSDFTIPPHITSTTFTVKSNSAWQIDGFSSTTWVQNVTPSSGPATTEPVTVTITTLVNTGEINNRTITMQLYNEDDDIDIVLSQEPVRFSIANRYNLSPTEGSHTFTLRPTADWEMINNNNLPWITNFGPTSGVAGEEATITITITENTTGVERRGSLRIQATHPDLILANQSPIYNRPEFTIGQSAYEAPVITGNNKNAVGENSITLSIAAIDYADSYNWYDGGVLKQSGEGLTYEVTGAGSHNITVAVVKGGQEKVTSQAFSVYILTWYTTQAEIETTLAGTWTVAEEYYSSNSWKTATPYTVTIAPVGAGQFTITGLAAYAKEALGNSSDFVVTATVGAPSINIPTQTLGQGTDMFGMPTTINIGGKDADPSTDLKPVMIGTDGVNHIILFTPSDDNSRKAEYLINNISTIFGTTSIYFRNVTLKRAL